MPALLQAIGACTNILDSASHRTLLKVASGWSRQVDMATSLASELGSSIPSHISENCAHKCPTLDGLSPNQVPSRGQNSGFTLFSQNEKHGSYSALL